MGGGGGQGGALARLLDGKMVIVSVQSILLSWHVRSTS